MSITDLYRNILTACHPKRLLEHAECLPLFYSGLRGWSALGSGHENPPSLFAGDSGKMAE